MRDLLFIRVKQFLDQQSEGEGALLLGCSGGVDSFALLHLLHLCNRPLRVAHVDHRWRLESSAEAEQLRQVVKELGYPFHLHTLSEVVRTEEFGRTKRLQFFGSVYRKFRCRALVLAHQGDDQSETVLKRVLEGASLDALGGMKAVSWFEEMEIWRPLLEVKKKEIESWLETKKLIPLQDPSNLDPTYLRGRMRRTIFPYLNNLFGKEVSGNLRKLGKVAQEMNRYLEGKMGPYNQLVQEMQEGIFIDLRSLYPFEPVELKFFLRKCSKRYQIPLSHDAIEQLYTLLHRGDKRKKMGPADRWIEVQGRSIAIKKE